MGRALAVLRVPDLAAARWPDGEITMAWELPAGTLLQVDEVIPVENGFIAVTHPVDAPEVFALVDVRDLTPADAPVPF